MQNRKDNKKNPRDLFAIRNRKEKEDLKIRLSPIIFIFANRLNKVVKE